MPPIHQIFSVITDFIFVVDPESIRISRSRMCMCSDGTNRCSGMETWKGSFLHGYCDFIYNKHVWKIIEFLFD